MARGRMFPLAPNVNPFVNGQVRNYSPNTINEIFLFIYVLNVKKQLRVVTTFYRESKEQIHSRLCSLFCAFYLATKEAKYFLIKSCFYSCFSYFGFEIRSVP